MHPIGLRDPREDRLPEANVDVLVLTALTEEQQVVHSVLRRCAAFVKNHGDVPNRMTLYEYQNGANEKYLLATASMHDMGAVAMTEFTVSLLGSGIRPAGAVLVGIAATLARDNVDVGDVPVASEVFAADDIKVEHGQLTFRTHGFQVDHRMRRAAGDIRAQGDLHRAWRERCRSMIAHVVEDLAADGLRPKPITVPDEVTLPRLVLEAGAGGPFLIADADFGQALLKGSATVQQLSPKLAWAEMEAHGFMKAVHAKAVPAIVVKGISDAGDADKAALEKQTGGFFRAYACSNAVVALLHMLDQRPWPPIPRSLHLGSATTPPDETEVAVESPEFSPLLVEAAAKMNRKIATLTEEQFRVIDFLRGHRRVAIAGCAGSGKTLVALEKAMRLHRAGLRTLLLCHNPHLAADLRAMAAGGGVEVRDFESWVRDLSGASVTHDDAWTLYHEPTDAELSAAFDGLTGPLHRYDAVVVDEGQDFRDTWWTVVEAALRSPPHGILYVFLDDHQALLPHRDGPPIVASPYTLSQNVRNAGRIFELVQHLHPQAPAPASALRDDGVVEWFPKNSIAQAITAALARLPTEHLVVVTTESDPASGSVLDRLVVETSEPWHWQDTVLECLRTIGAGGPFPSMSSAPAPTHKDVVAVCEWARRWVATQYGGRHDHLAPTLKRLRWYPREGGRGLGPRASPSEIAAFLCRPDWHAGIPAPQHVRVVADAPASRSVIPLHTVASFKGREADGVVLYVARAADGLASVRRALAYVGVTRARFLLHIIADATGIAALR